MIRVLMVTLLITLSGQALAVQSVDLGLWTYHFDRVPPEGECTNEKHNLLTIRDGSYGIGLYKNSHCLQSYFVSYRYSLDENWHLDVSAVSGYPKSMHVAGGFIVMPSLTFTKHYRNIGVSLIVIPKVLVGGGLNYRFKGF